MYLRKLLLAVMELFFKFSINKKIKTSQAIDILQDGWDGSTSGTSHGQPRKSLPKFDENSR